MEKTVEEQLNGVDLEKIKSTIDTREAIANAVSTSCIHLK